MENEDVVQLDDHAVGMDSAAVAYRAQVAHNERNDLVVQHLEYVRHILGRITFALPLGVDLENLESAGILGLVEASQQFDAGRGVPFKAYAYNRIRGAIIDELRRNCPLPQQVLKDVAIVRKASESLDPPITPEAVAKETGLSVQRVEASLAAIQLTRPQLWDETTLSIQVTGRDDVDDPAVLVDAEEAKHILADCIEQLPEKERLTVTLYYLEDLRLKEIGVVLGLSESRVSRILNDAERRLKELVEAKQR